MNSESLVVLVIVAFATAFIVRRVWHVARTARTTKSACASDCGCDTQSKSKDWAD